MQQPKNLLKDFKRPKSVYYDKETQTQFYGKFVAHPFDRGLGVTIANSLRRTLLSSISGYASSAFRIEYVNDHGKQSLLTNEFENIYGVVEDTVEIIQNLKSIRAQLLDGSEGRTIAIDIKGPKDFKASDLEVDANIKILNPELHIATLNEDASFNFRLHIAEGRGFTAAEEKKDLIDEIGVIPIDSIFSPVKKVNFDIEKARIGQSADYDKIILEVWTDGSIEPQNAIAYAAKIMKEHFTTFINFEEEPEEEELVTNEEEERLRQLLETTIEELELSVRSSNCLRVAGIQKIGDLVSYTDEEIEKIKNLGKKSIHEIIEKLAEYNLTLGMKDIPYQPKQKKLVSSESTVKV